MNKEKLQSFIKKRKNLVWWVKNHSELSPESIVEATLNYGDWDDVQELIEILGIEKVAEIFRKNSKPSEMGRQNYDIKTKNYFDLYFDKHCKQNA
ncbi:MAG: hypothetical protein ACQEP6_00715 [Patescibacteria group bacterium]